MSDQINLADPDVEPTDAQLIGLSTRAFAGVTEAHEQALQRIRAKIVAERSIVLRDLTERRAAGPRDPK